MSHCRVGSSPEPTHRTKDIDMSKTPEKPMLHVEKCVTCNNNNATWDIYSKLAKKGAIVNLQLECTGCGDLMPMSATMTNLRLTFGLEKVDQLIGKKPL